MKPDKLGIIVTGGGVVFAVISCAMAQIQIREPGNGSYVFGPSLITALLAFLLALIGSVLLAAKGRGTRRIVGVLIGAATIVFCVILLGAVGPTTFVLPR